MLGVQVECKPAGHRRGRSYCALHVLFRLTKSLKPSTDVTVTPASEVRANRLAYEKRFAQHVFVVYGRDRAAQLEVTHWLNKFGVQVHMLESDTAQGSKSVAEAIEDHLLGCGTGIVIGTPDDLGRLKGTSTALQARVRQNVLLEFGYLIGLLGRERVVVLLHSSCVSDFPSDLAGAFTIRFQNHISECFDALRGQLQALGVLTLGSGKPAKPA